MEENTYMSFDSLDIDTISLPSLPPRNGPRVYNWTKPDEILLDSEDRPLDLAVNANAPVTFNLVAGSDRTAEVLRSLQEGSFTPLQRRKLMEKFNIDDDMMSSSDFGDARTSQSSASESTGKPDSLEGSPIPSDRRFPRFRASFSNVRSFSKNKESSPRGRSDLRNLEHLQNGKNKSRKSEKGDHILSVNTLPRVQQNGKAETKQAKRPQPSSQRQGREQGVSASARKIFSSLRKTARGRSASRERREKQTPTKLPSKSVSHQDDLSADVHLPGILKIFGDVVSPGAKYKSVLATRQSKARELVKAALERYGVPRSMGKQYVLCEVVGRIRMEKVAIKVDPKDSRTGYSMKLSQQDENENTREILDETFVEDYVRPLNDHEKPLILQSYWKPLEGYARRFELRERSQVINQITTEKDRETKDVNAQAKRLILKNTRLSRTQSSLNVKVNATLESSSDEEGDENGKSVVIEEIPEQNSHQMEHPTPPTPEQFADHEVSESGDDIAEVQVPFLLTLQGEDGISSGSSKSGGGSLVHHLDRKVTVIGNNQCETAHGVETPPAASDEVNIRLSGQDIKPHHCVVYRVKRESKEDGSASSSPWKVTLHLVADDCGVTVNGQAVASDKEIFHGDIVSIGSKYIFMLKDPASKTNLNSNMRLTGLNSNISSLNSIASRGSAFTPVKKRCVEMEITYRPEYEEQVLDVIFAAANDIVNSSRSKPMSENCERELAPARFLIHCIEQSCFNVSLEQKKTLLFVIATNLQTILLDATGNVSMQDDSIIKNPEEGINYILPKLEDVVFWMSNSLEIFSYLQTDLVDRVKARVAKEMELNEVDPNILNDAASFHVTDDVLAVLEEIVMYAFQQLVYYLTKTLYGALPKVLDTNPFSEVSEDSEGAVRGTGYVTTIYDAALALTRKYGVHPEIESQLFAYLFFFTNVSLFNTLMEDEACGKYYRWDKGVQIRGNLEEIECWANDNDFQDQATKFLEKFSTLTNLLASTKTQMLQSTWSHFRRDFPQLHPVQLRQILDGYILGPRVKKRPAEWIPDSEDLEESTAEEHLLESYDNHPPLVLPTNGTQIDLDETPVAAWYNALKEVVLAVGQGRDVEPTSVNGVWRPNANQNNSTFGERQQPDGREISISQQSYVHSPISPSSTTSSQATNQYLNPDRTKSDIVATMRPHSPSSTSLSSMMSDSTSQASLTGDIKADTGKYLKSHNGYATFTAKAEPASPKPAPRRNAPGPLSQNMGPNGDNDIRRPRGSTKSATLDRPRKKNRQKASKEQTDDQSCDYESLLPRDVHAAARKGTSNETTENPAEASEEPPEDSFVDVNDISQISADAIGDLLVLPVNTTIIKRSEIEYNTQRRKQQSSPSSSERSNDSSMSMPNEVFIVDVVKGRKGLGLGLVDGMFTSLQVPGVFVRSLVPDGPSVKHVRMKHQEVIKCWLKEGRLLLGDRILAVNGSSLISMDYTSAMEELRQAGDRMRFLVGRSGPDVAMKITSSSC